MAGDVASAYRNACTHNECAFMFAGHIPEDNAIVIDLSGQRLGGLAALERTAS
ncbi:hypothetical protein PC120_g21267 [Phytophthora cactorum]|nr:hypothetical protein PC120_g21267 [Phytophthora cactorum]